MIAARGDAARRGAAARQRAQSDAGRLDDAALATLRWPCGKAVVCTDAFTHVIPWMRDLGQWLGAREVTREAIGLSLRSGASVVLVPGGQAERFATSAYTKQVRIYRGHRGFVRVALQHLHAAEKVREGERRREIAPGGRR